MLDNWALRWNIPPKAIQEFRQLVGIYNDAVFKNETEGTEAYVQQQLRLTAPKHGVRLWRNNNGACYDETGRLVRYGLANDSAQLSKKIKSSDLIGIWPYIVQPHDVGKTLGIFTSIEVKKPGWTFKGTDRENAQLAWINLIVSLGGFAKFANKVNDLWPE